MKDGWITLVERIDGSHTHRHLLKSCVTNQDLFLPQEHPDSLLLRYMVVRVLNLPNDHLSHQFPPFGKIMNYNTEHQF